MAQSAIKREMEPWNNNFGCHFVICVIASQKQDGCQILTLKMLDLLNKAVLDTLFVEQYLKPEVSKSMQ